MSEKRDYPESIAEIQHFKIQRSGRVRESREKYPGAKVVDTMQTVGYSDFILV